MRIHVTLLKKRMSESTSTNRIVYVPIGDAVHYSKNINAWYLINEVSANRITLNYLKNKALLIVCNEIDYAWSEMPDMLPFIL